MDLPEAVAEDAVASSEFGALPRCGSSAIVAVSPDAGSNWMAAEELGPLWGRGGSSILAKGEGELEPL